MPPQSALFNFSRIRLNNFSFPQVRLLNTQTKSLKSIGIRAEDKSRWERRAPLTPDAVHRLVKETGVKVYVQPSYKRVFNDEQYEKAGATVTAELGDADIILGIKEVPVPKLLPDKTYLYFSHTHKGQIYNMPMLQNVIDKKIKLVDYELMVDENGRRVVLFGKHAGFAGMIDGLHGLGTRLLGLGYSTPFLNIGMSHTYSSLASAKAAVQNIGNIIAEDGLPKDLGPMTFVFTGDGGNVAMGAKEVFSHLPMEWIGVEELRRIAEGQESYKYNKVYGVAVNIHDYLVRRDTGVFVSREDYFTNPQEYESKFHEKIAPFATMIINGAYWDKPFPRMLTTEQLGTIQMDPARKFRMLSVADISCDIEGGFEFTSHSTKIDNAFYYVDAIKGVEHQDVEGLGTQVMSIDILPTELPRDASEHFSEALSPYLEQMIHNNDGHPVILGATIAENGKLAPRHSKLYSLLEKHGRQKEVGVGIKIGNTKKKVLLLGSGFVAKPLVDYLLKDSNIGITIASNSLSEATQLSSNHPNTAVTHLDVQNKPQLTQLVSSADVVVSFVPAPLHPSIAAICIQTGTHMVTASYISEAMKALDSDAKNAGITIMNEIGLDPGIDHLSAMKIIDEVKSKGGKVKSFVSWCGGLPAPEASDVPLGYKFSWSPKGVLTAGLNDAQFKMNGKLERIPGSSLLQSHFPDVPIFRGFALEGVANRNSLPYAGVYGLGKIDTIDTMFRGTLRYKGYSDLMSAFRRIGLLEQGSTVNYKSWPDFLDSLLFKSSNIVNPSDVSRMDAIADKLDLTRQHPMVEKTMEALSWFGLLPNSDITSSLTLPPPIATATTPLDAFCTLLQHKLKYNPGERDMVILHHEFEVTNKNGSEETRTSSLVSYGSFETYTAMAKTVGLPAAMATEMILNGEIPERGVLAPTLQHIYDPILKKLRVEGVDCVEKTIQKGIKKELKLGGSGIWVQ